MCVYFDFQTLKFKALLLVRSFSFPVARKPPKLVITMHPSIQEVDLATIDIFFNSITMTIQLCRQKDGKLWRGAKKKFEVLIKPFVHTLSLVGSIVADITASTNIVFYNIQLLVYKFLIYTSIFINF